MNFLAHVHVALGMAERAGHADDRAAYAFGAALPDLASMARIRIDPSVLPRPVRKGVALHHETDRAFHALADFTSGVRTLTRGLREAGLGTGPSRAVGHAGWELLLDGCLLGRPETADAFEGVLAGAPDLAEIIAPEDPDRWRFLLGTMAEDRWWLGYRDPEVVASRLQRLLRDRRRLSFSSAKIEDVTHALTDERPRVEAVSDRVLAAVIASASAETAPTPPR